MPSPPSPNGSGTGPPRVNGALPTAPEDPDASGEFQNGTLKRENWNVNSTKSIQKYPKVELGFNPPKQEN